MMKNYIFLTNQYLPKTGATGLCVHNIAKQLANEGNSVWTICYEDGDITKEFDGVKVKKVKIPSFLKNNQSSSNLKRKLQYIGSLFCKFIYIKNYPLRSMTLVHNYINEVEAILNNVDFVTIVASYTPLEAVVAAMKIKQKFSDKVKIIYYSTDTLSNERGADGLLSAEYRTKCGIKWEKKLFNVFDKILIMECHELHYKRKCFEQFQKKMEVVNFPLYISQDQISQINKNDKKITLVYAGTLYKKLRNPEFLISLLLEIADEVDYEALFLGSSDCEDILRVAESRSNGKIKYLGMQPHNIALQYIKSADLLLSIGNVESPMAPSKIYEYMSSGKPIIHTYSYEKDPCLDPLAKYGNSMLIPETQNIEKLDDLIEFIKNRIIVDHEMLDEIFETSKPIYTANIIKK